MFYKLLYINIYNNSYRLYYKSIIATKKEYKCIRYYNIKYYKISTAIGYRAYII